VRRSMPMTVLSMWMGADFPLYAIALQFGWLSGKNFKYFEVLLDGFLLRWHSHRR
jgi:hypothetical protein